MANGFETAGDFSRIVGWELYQVTFDKYHVMFWFENGHALLNVADRFSFRSADGLVSYTYELYGTSKKADLDRILRVAVKRVTAVSDRQLDLTFENGDVLTVHDNPEFRSWWFYRYGPSSKPPQPSGTVVWEIDDGDPIESREELLQVLLNLAVPLGDVQRWLEALPWDSESELVVLGREHVRSILSRYLSGSLDSKTVEDWANAIEGREDIQLSANDRLLADVLHELANPAITIELTPARAGVLLKGLRVSGAGSD